MDVFGLGEFLFLDISWAILVLLIARLFVLASLNIAYKKVFTKDSQKKKVGAEFFEGDSFPEKIVSVSLSSAYEEVKYRWALFYIAIPAVRLIDYLTFGLFGGVYRTFFAPVADFMTLGFLSPQLTEGWWVIGAAVLWVNASFRRGHAYLGFIGWANSWFGGMIYFYAMFNHGLFMAMLGHIVYNLALLAIVSLQEQFTDQPAWA